MEATRRWTLRRLAAEFDPALDRVGDVPPPHLARRVTYAMAAALAAALAWAALARTERVVVAPARIAAAAPAIVLAPAEPAVVRSVHAKPGEAVAAGAVVVALDDTAAQAELAQLETRHAALSARLARLEAERAERGEIGGDATPALAEQRAVLAARQADRAAQRERLEAEAARAARAIASLERTLAETRETSLVAGRIQGMREELLRRELGSRLNLMLDELQATARRAETARMEGELDQARAAPRLVAASLAAFEAGWRREVAEELETVRRERDTVAEELVKARRRVALLALRAPRDGVLLDLLDLSPGTALPQAEPVGRLIPSGTALEIVLEVASRDAAHLSPGAAVRVRLPSLPADRHGALQGRLRSVAPDTTAKQDGRTIYRAHADIAADGGLRDLPPGFRLGPGLEGEAQILIGTRSILRYLFEPLLDLRDTALREP